MKNYLLNLAEKISYKNERISVKEKKLYQKILYNGILLLINFSVEVLLYLDYRILCLHIKPLEDDVIKPIISVTTFPKRVGSLWMVLISIYHQKYRPGKIVVTLSKEEFPNELDDVPNSIKRFMDKGVEILFVEDNLGPHKKYFYSMQKYIDRVIITIDDDVIYWRDTISALMKLHSKFPLCVCGNRVMYVNLEANSFSPIPFFNNVIKNGNLAVGVCGVLYPVNFRPKELFNKNVIMETCLNADDIWLMFQEIIADVCVIGNGEYPDPLCILKSQKMALMKNNVNNNGNTKQFLNLKKHYSLYGSNK